MEGSCLENSAKHIEFGVLCSIACDSVHSLINVSIEMDNVYLQQESQTSIGRDTKASAHPPGRSDMWWKTGMPPCRCTLDCSGSTSGVSTIPSPLNSLYMSSAAAHVQLFIHVCIRLEQNYTHKFHGKINAYIRDGQHPHAEILLSSMVRFV